MYNADLQTALPSLGTPTGTTPKYFTTTTMDIEEGNIRDNTL
jgi:hypothetical protein